MNQKDIVDDALIAKFLAGEATPEEAMMITDWAQSAENEILFDQLQRAFVLQRYVRVSPENRAEIRDSVIGNRNVAPIRVAFFTPM
jgi:hypothetical protein